MALVSAQGTGHARKRPSTWRWRTWRRQLDLLRDVEFRARLAQLLADLRSCLGLGGGTVTVTV